MVMVRLDRERRIRIPENVCRRLGLKVGDVLKMTISMGKLIIEPLRKIRDPIEDMLNIVKEPMDVDAVRLVEESWDED